MYPSVRSFPSNPILTCLLGIAHRRECRFDTLLDVEGENAKAKAFDHTAEFYTKMAETLRP